MKILLGLPILLLLVAAFAACSKSPTPTPVPTPTAIPAATATPGPTETPYRIEYLKIGHHEIPITPKSDSLMEISYKSTAFMTVVVSDQSGKIFFSGGSSQGNGFAVLKADVLYTIVVGAQSDATVQYRLVANAAK